VDTTPHTARRLVATRNQAAVAVGLIVLAGGVARLAVAQPPSAATSPAPAARLKPPQPIDEPSRPIVGRGTAPDSSPVSVHPTATVPQPPSRPGWLVGPGYTSSRPLVGGGTQSQPASRPPAVISQPVPAVRRPGPVESAWNGVKEFVAGPPVVPFTAPGTMPGATQPAPVRSPLTTPGRETSGGVYAGPPAYRWYGWGTTTPGANPYAPTGQYPRASANWYSQTGATPGAFPVPVMNPYRPEPGAEPPTYVRGATPEPLYTAPPRWGSADFPPELHYTTTPATQPRPATRTGGGPSATVPVPPGPPPAAGQGDILPVIAQSGPTVPVGAPVPASAVIESPGLVEQPADGGLIWQRSGEGHPIRFGAPPPPATSAPPTVTVIRGQEPTPKESPLEAVVRSACRGLATVMEVREVERAKPTDPPTLLVRVAVATEDDAQAAFDALTAAPQLGPYKITFKADLAGR
jgi:hypothetical protein